MIAALILAIQLKSPDRHLYQIGTFAALAAGKYDGDEAIGRLPSCGDFGVGTFNGLNGEMVVLDSRIYHANGFGDVDILPMSTNTPFACVVHFRPDVSIAVTSPKSSAGLQAQIDAKVGNERRLLAIKVVGRFSDMQARAYAPQIKPYLPLSQLKDAQSIFPFASIEGTFVGFRLPKDIGPLNVPGYHFHFVSNDRRHAGHVLSYKLDSGRVEIMVLDSKITRI